MAFKKEFRHFVPKAQRVKDYPFSYNMVELTDKDIKPDVTTSMTIKVDDINEVISNALIQVFDFYKYLDEDSPYYLPKKKESPTYIVGLNIYQETYVLDEKTKKSKKQKNLVNILNISCFNFKSRFSFTLIKSIDHLKTILSQPYKRISYDAETSGLDPEYNKIAGINFALDTNLYKGYYMALGHEKPYNNYNIPIDEALDIFYDALKRAELVYFFNARFDIRVLEYYKCDKTPYGTIENIKYDMSVINLRDVQISMYFADPEWREHGLKWGEKHFLGYYRLDLEDTLSANGITNFDTTKIDPTKLLFYACQDGISTLQLGLETDKYYTEFGLSGQIDQEIIYPLMSCENRLLRIDYDYNNKQLEYIEPRLEELNRLIKESVGYDINLNSPKQKIELFKAFGLDTGKTTDTGNMSTDKDAINELIKELENADKEIPEWLKYLGERSRLEKLNSTYFSSLKQQAKFRDGRVRLHYRHGITATGRFSSGKEE